jgi:diguanylate cyclase (GGDEF)-like protein
MAHIVNAEPSAPDSWVAEEERVAALQHSRLLDVPPEPEFDRWTAALREDTGAAAAALLLVDAAQVFVKSLATTDGCADELSSVGLSEPLDEYLLGRADPLAAIDPSCAYVQAPVSVDGQLLGWMALADHSHRDWSQSDLRALNDAAAAASTEVSLRRANRGAVRIRELVASHNHLHELIAAAAPLSDVLGELVNGIEAYEPSVIPCVVLLDHDTSTLHPGAGGPSLPKAWLAAIEGVVIGPNVGTCGSAAWSGDLTISEDMLEDPKWAPVRDLVMRFGLRHCWSMPIKTHDGEVLGTIALYGLRPRLPLPEHLALMRDGARLAGIAIERNRMMEQLIHDARHDGLTGLPNRRAIFERLDEAVLTARPANTGAVLFVDLDGLKLLNDTLGHDQADALIRQTGERLSAALRAEDFVGRFGGDEFVVVAAGADAEQAAQLGARLLEVISKPLPGIGSAAITASVGIALIGDGDAGEAIRHADSAMYAAKHEGGDACSFFNGTQRVRIGRRLSLSRELRDAEMRGEMHLVFQPVFQLVGLEVVAVEALMRWTSPRFGVVSPTEFIPIAEDSGAIVPLGAWMLRESCETLTRVTARGARPLELGVNVTAHQVSNPGFAQSVHQTLTHAEFPADLLTLEIAETALILPDATSSRTLSDLESLGVRIVLDDFGTGYSSLGWLKDHPRDGIKIYGGLVSELRDDIGGQAMVAAVIGMARALDSTVTAQGVETDAQLAALRALGCGRAQGFLLARPMPEDELYTLLR